MTYNFFNSCILRMHNTTSFILNGNPVILNIVFGLLVFFKSSFDLPTCILNPKLTKLELGIIKKKN